MNEEANAQAPPAVSPDTPVTRQTLVNSQPFASTLGQFVEEILSGKYRAALEEIRACKDKDERRGLKNDKLPAITPGACFKGKRLKDQPFTATALVVVDLDDLKEKPAVVRDKLFELPQVACAFISPSGNGVKAFVHVHPAPVNDAQNKAAFTRVAAAVERHGWKVDTSGQDISRLCFVSWDPEAKVRWDAPAMDVTPPQPEPLREPGPVELVAQEPSESSAVVVPLSFEELHFRFTEKCVRDIATALSSDVSRNDWLYRMYALFGVAVADAGMSPQDAQDMVIDWCRKAVNHPLEDEAKVRTSDLPLDREFDADQERRNLMKLIRAIDWKPDFIPLPATVRRWVLWEGMADAVASLEDYNTTTPALGLVFDPQAADWYQQHKKDKKDGRILHWQRLPRRRDEALAKLAKCYIWQMKEVIDSYSAMNARAKVRNPELVDIKGKLKSGWSQQMGKALEERMYGPFHPDLDNHPEVQPYSSMATPSGVLTVTREGTALVPFDPEIHRHVVMTPAPYDDSMFGEFEDRFLKTWFPDASVRAYLQRLFGAALVGQAHRKFISIMCASGSGKSTFTALTKSAFGRLAATPPPTTFSRAQAQRGHNDGIVDLIENEPRFCFLSEAGGIKIDAALINAVTGADAVSARRSGSVTGLVEGRVRALPIFVGEKAIQVEGFTSGTQDRQVVVELQAPENPDLQVLKGAEKAGGPWAQGMFAWAVRGAVAFLNEPDCLSRKPEPSEQAAHKALELQAPLEAWLLRRGPELDGRSSTAILELYRGDPDVDPKMKDSMSSVAIGRAMAGLKQFSQASSRDNPDGKKVNIWRYQSETGSTESVESGIPLRSQDQAQSNGKLKTAMEILGTGSESEG